MALLPTLAHATAATPTITPTATETATATASPSPTITETAVCGSTVGCYGCSTVGAGGATNYFYANQFTLATGANVNQLWVYLDFAAGGSFRMGIYSDSANNIGTLLYDSGNAPEANGWQEIAVSPFYLPAGTYWLAVIQQTAGTLQNTYAGGRGMYAQVSYGNFPSQLTASNYPAYFSNNLTLAYISYCPGPPLFPSPTVTPTMSYTAIQYLSSGAGKLALGPVPVHKGTPLCLYYEQAPLSSTWEVYNLMGQRVSSLSFDTGAQACWDTTNVAPGIYVVKASVNYAAGGSKTLMQKVVVLK